MRLLWRRDRADGAGGSARVAYARALRGWRRQIGPPIAVAVGATALISIPIYMFAPGGQFFAGLWLGALAGMLQWLWDDPPEHIAHWGRGADGEVATAKALDRLVEWRAFHDRIDPYGNLDHIVVGPGGVYVLDSKNLSGTVMVDRRGLTISHPDTPSRPKTYGIGQGTRHASRRMSGELRATVGVKLWVQAVIVIWGDFPAGVVKANEVFYVAGNRIADWLAVRPRTLEPREMRLIELALEAGLIAPPASLDAA